MTGVKQVIRRRQKQRLVDLATVMAHLERGTHPHLETRYWGGTEWAIARLVIGPGWDLILRAFDPDKKRGWR